MRGDEVYFDTSALLAYYREEPSSNRVQKLLDQVDPPLQVSDLTRVEVASAIARWVRMNEINESQAAMIENAFSQDVQSGLYRFRPLTTTHYRQAERWLSTRKTALRTLDALHVACCWNFGARLITCDRLMHEGALMVGVEGEWISS
jgi:predicted nucleic acid-binding protein